MIKSRKFQFGLLELFVIASLGYMIMLLFVYLMKPCIEVVDCLSVSSTIISPFLTLLAVGYVGVSIYGDKFSRLQNLYVDLSYEMEGVLRNYKILSEYAHKNYDNNYLTSRRVEMECGSLNDPVKEIKQALFKVECLNARLMIISPQNKICEIISQNIKNLHTLLNSWNFVDIINKIQDDLIESIEVGDKLENIKNMISEKLKSDKL